MRPFVRHALGTSAAAALLAGCGGSVPPVALPHLVPQTKALLASDHTGGWIMPQANNQDLLYVTDGNVVRVYSYPQGQLVGTLKGFNSAVGECVDSKGNVYIPAYSKSRHLIAEFAHGGSKPIVRLQTSEDLGAIGCSIDPTTGDLAASGFGEPPTINVFLRARGKAVLYKASGFVETQFCAYDDKGNLFVDGLQTWSGKPMVAELAKGSKTFVTIKLDRKIDPEQALQWDGKYVAIGSYIYPHSGQPIPVIYRFAVSGTRGTAVGRTLLGKPAYVIFQFYIFDRTILVPDWPSSGKYDVLRYKYPAGGSPNLTITKYMTFPRGVVVSRVAQ
jgi:hypothetical protein